DDTVIVHVVSEKGAELKCSSDACATTKVPDTGEVDLEVKLPSGSSKSVFLSGKKGLKKKQIYVDLSAGTPPTLTVKAGDIKCVPDGCTGTLTIAPSPEVLIEAAAGTLVEIEGEKVKVPEGGSATLAFPSPLSPPLEKQPLTKVCAGYVSSTKPSPILGSTTLSLTFPDGRKSTAKIDIDAHLVEKGLSKGLAEIENGPIVFPWEKAGTPARGKRAGVYVNGDYC